MVPGNIAKEHILRALTEIDQHGVPAGRHGHSYELRYQSKTYPPKYVVSIANLYANGRELDPSSFHNSSPHHEANNLLEALGFEVREKAPLEASAVVPKAPGKRNPPWRREELILALHYCLSRPLSEHSASNPGIIELSETLNKLPFHESRPDLERFRNPNGCEMKLCSFRAFDPNYEGKGLDAGSKLDKAIWEEFYGDQERLYREAATIRALVTNPNTLSEVSHPEEGEEGHQEGALKYRLHRARERSSKVVEQAKKAWGKDPKCEVCSLSFGETYPGVGEGFIEAHHRVPLAELGTETVTKPSDLAPVCANCHRMLQRISKFTIESLQQIMAVAIGRR